MKVYLVLELTRLMESGCDVYNTVHGVFKSKEDAIKRFTIEKKNIEDDFNGGDVETDTEMSFEMARGYDTIELKIEELEVV